jgi:hypothetical protein
MTSSAADLRRRVLGWRAAERRDQAQRAHEGPMDAALALEAAFELHELFAATVTGADAVRARDVANARNAWRKLRTRLACPPTTAR